MAPSCVRCSAHIRRVVTLEEQTNGLYALIGVMIFFHVWVWVCVCEWFFPLSFGGFWIITREQKGAAMFRCRMLQVSHPVEMFARKVVLLPVRHVGRLMKIFY